MFKPPLLVRAGLFVSVGLIGIAPGAFASEIDHLTAMLEEFLATSHKQAAHERFWAEDLVYTSSSGARFGKTEILEGFAAPDSREEHEPAIVYSGEDIDVRLYGTTAVVAFRLVGTPGKSSAETGVSYYFNTGTFLKRDGAWQVVAWQATKIPPTADN